MIFTKEGAGKKAKEALGEHSSPISEHVLAYLIGTSTIDKDGHLLTPVVTLREICEGSEYKPMKVAEAIDQLVGMKLLASYYDGNAAHARRYFVLPKERFSYDELFPETVDEASEEKPEVEVVPPEKVYIIEDESGCIALREFYTSLLVAELCATVLNASRTSVEKDDGCEYYVVELLISNNEVRLRNERLVD